MSRIRTIKPEFWTSEQIVECSIPARLLFIGMWNFADDQGVIPASAKQLKMQILPGDDLSVAQVLAMVKELIAQELVTEFEWESKRYWWITGWKRHQKIDRPSPKYPPPPFNEDSTNIRRVLDEDSTNIRRVLDEDSTNIRRVLDEDSTQEGKGRERNIERKGRERKGEDTTRARATRTTPTKTSLPIDLTITPALQAWAENHGYGDLDMHLESFKDKAQAKGYQYIDWEAALRNAIRDDWAGIRKPAPARRNSTGQSKEDAKLETFHKLTGGLAGRKNGEPPYENVIDITPSAIRVG